MKAGPALSVFTMQLKDAVNYDKFIEFRKKTLKDTMILNTAKWYCRYKLEIQLKK